MDISEVFRNASLNYGYLDPGKVSLLGFRWFSYHIISNKILYLVHYCKLGI